MKFGSFWMTALVVCLFSGVVAYAETITFQNEVSPTTDYFGSADVHIISFFGTGNQTTRPPESTPRNTGGHIYIEEGDYGDAPSLANADLSLDSKVILVSFDLSSIPASRSKEIVKTQLGLYFVYERVKGSDTNAAAGLKNPHNLNTQKILRKWAEGEEEGVDGVSAPDNTEEVTWNSTGYELWEAIGAEGPTDVGPVESSTYFECVPGAWIWFDVTKMSREWIAEPSTNFGVKISQETDNDPTNTPTFYVVGCYNFVSKENDDITHHPQLVVELGTVTPVDNWSLFE